MSDKIVLEDTEGAFRSQPSKHNMAFSPSVGGLFIVSFGGARNPRRDMVSKGTNLEEVGWVSRFRLLAFDHNPDPYYGQQIFISEAPGPHRILVSTKTIENSGWTPRLNFWAYSQDVGDCVMVAVAEAKDPHRCKFEIGRKIGNAPEDAGWEQILVFWVKSRSFS